MSLEQTAPVRKGSPRRWTALATAVHRFRPELVEALREGYGWKAFWRDASAGLTVATVALPVSMAFAIASGVSPERGLYASVIGGALGSALGGARVVITGPAGVFIALNAATLSAFGLDGLFAAMMLAGLMLVAVGVLGLGGLIDRVPRPVIVGFTTGLAITTFVAQWKDLGALQLHGSNPASFNERLAALVAAFPSTNPAALAVGTGTAMLTALIGKVRPRWPAMLLALMAATIVTACFHLSVVTIGSGYGELPHRFPLPRLPNFSGAALLHLIPTAISFALLSVSDVPTSPSLMWVERAL